MEQFDKGGVARSAAENDQGRVKLGAKRQMLSPAALSQQGRRHLGPRASSERGGGVTAAIVAAGCLGHCRQAQLLQLRPDVHQIPQGCQAADASSAA